jgi:hypothetical protein
LEDSQLLIFDEYRTKPLPKGSRSRNPEGEKGAGVGLGTGTEAREGGGSVDTPESTRGLRPAARDAAA